MLKEFTSQMPLLSPSGPGGVNTGLSGLPPLAGENDRNFPFRSYVPRELSPTTHFVYNLIFSDLEKRSCVDRCDSLCA